MSFFSLPTRERRPTRPGAAGAGRADGPPPSPSPATQHTAPPSSHRPPPCPRRPVFTHALCARPLREAARRVWQGSHVGGTCRVPPTGCLYMGTEPSHAARARSLPCPAVLEWRFVARSLPFPTIPDRSCLIAEPPTSRRDRSPPHVAHGRALCACAVRTSFCLAASDVTKGRILSSDNSLYVDDLRSDDMRGARATKGGPTDDERDHTASAPPRACADATSDGETMGLSMEKTPCERRAQ